VLTPEQVPDIPLDDFNVFLHELRTRELRKLPPGAKTVLSGGCSGGWYFRWVKDCYPGLTRHIGVEAYSPKPTDLPPEAEWIPNYLGNMTDVPDASVDLVFAGHTTEHMWPDDLAAFLCESHRVLSADGLLALDSPNRRLTHMLGWYHPQHTAEHTIDEIVALVRAAGFDRVSVRGVWLCYAREDHLPLPLQPTAGPPEWGWRRRVAASADRPEDCFAWWLEARRGPNPPDRGRVTELAHKAYAVAFPAAVRREFTTGGRVVGVGDERVVLWDAGRGGYVCYGPYIPLQPGTYEVRFPIARRPGGPDLPPDQIVAEVDATAETGAVQMGSRAVHARDLVCGELRHIPLTFTTTETRFGCEFRVVSNGALPLAVGLSRSLVSLDSVWRTLTG
jgi:hypothetical protein